MEKITNFCIDHDILGEEMYVSRTDEDIIIYDPRMVKPNRGMYLDNDDLHIFEHSFAIYVRNSIHSDAVIYVGSTGCRTGFYFLMRDSTSKA